MPDEIELGTVAKPWMDGGLQRGREVFVARRKGHVVAFALLEWCEWGTHIFSLNDAVRILFVGDADAEAADRLIDRCRLRFGELGRTSFTVVAPLDDAHVPQRAVDLGETDTIMISGEIMPDFVEYLMERMAAR